MSMARNDHVQAAAFFLLALAGSCIVALNYQKLQDATLLLAMFVPFLAVLIVRMTVCRDFFSGVAWGALGISRLGISHWGWALFLPLAVLLPGYLLVWGGGFGTWTGLNLAGTTSDDLAKSLIRLLLIIGPAVLAEEIGWRGFLMPRLLGIGRWPAAYLTGFFHGVWHLPLIVLTPYYHNGGSLWLTLPLFLAVLTVAGGVYGFLRLSSYSLWPVVVAHLSFNGVWENLRNSTVSDGSPVMGYLAGEVGLVTFVMLVLVNSLIYRAWGRRRRFRRYPDYSEAP